MKNKRFPSTNKSGRDKIKGNGKDSAKDPTNELEHEVTKLTLGKRKKPINSFDY